MNELRQDDQISFQNFVRVPIELFDEILQRIAHKIEKEDTTFRKALDSGLKLAVTLRHLASGDLYSTLSYDFRVSRSMISKFVPEVCRAIVEEYKDEVIQCPNTPDGWRAIAEEFERKWNVPHALGAIDGKHVSIKCPPGSGSLFHNNKGFFSVVLLALVDSDYRFRWVDVGGMGHMSDAQIYNGSELKECIEDDTIGFPEPEPLRHDNQDMPYYILGDNAFGLKKYLMKPYSRRGLSDAELVYNYRISRGRRVVENAFGIMAMRWQCLLRTLQQSPDVVRDIVETCICLHNLMRLRYPTDHHADVDKEDEHHNNVPGEWRRNANMHKVEQVVGPNRDTTEAKRQREVLKLYFNSSVGSVPWQERMIHARKS